MPLPLRTLRVLPNPWTMIHLEKGPQGVCATDAGGRPDAPLRFVGAERFSRVLEERRKDDPRGNRVEILFQYPALREDLTAGTALVVPATSGYYRERLANGDLVPADKATADAAPCRFTSLKEAREHGIAAFEAQFGKGSFAEAFQDTRPELFGKPNVKGASETTANAAETTSNGGGTK
jgi:hypothetical protein